MPLVLPSSLPFLSVDLFDFTPTGGTNYLLTCLLKTFNKAITTSHDGTHLLTVFTEAASKFHGSLSRTPGHLTPVLKESNRLYGFDPFFIETGTRAPFSVRREQHLSIQVTAFCQSFSTDMDSEPLPPFLSRV